MEAPTNFLPRIKRLDEYTASQIHEFLTRLVTIYLPKVRGTAPIDEDTETLQLDDFERSFTIRWLTSFIARGEEWTELYTDGEEDLGGGAPAATCNSSIGRFQTEFLDDTYLARTTAYDRAAALLGTCAGTSASGVLYRELKFATSSIPSTDDARPTKSDSGPSPITILLRDESISAGDHTAVGLQTWGSACILAERIARDPVSFGLPDVSSDSLSKSNAARVLELGAGTGLLSLLAGKLVERAGAATGKDNMNYTIIATDYHPAVLENLRANVQGNFPDSNTESDTSVDVRPLDWSLYLTGKPTTDLSRAPSTAPTPAVGTPVSGSGQNGIEPKTSATTLSTQGTSMPGSAVSPPIQTPSFSIASSVSTPTTSHSPQTPQTPRTARSPPPNLARAVFSRLVARGLKFEMPGGPPGVDQNSEQAKRSDSCPESPNLEDDFSAHSIDSVPITISVDPSVPSPDSDGPMIENDEVIETKKSPPRTSSPLLPLDASRSELVCANLQDKTIVSSTSNAGNNYLTPCLDEIDALHCLVNEEMIFNTDEDQHPASSHTPVPGAQVIPIGDEVRSAHFEASNKVMCLWDDSPIGDSAVGTEAPPFKIAERADGPVHDWSLGQRQAPHMASPITASTYPLGELRTPNTIDSNIDTTEKPHPELPHANKENDNPYNFMSSDSTNNMGRMSNCQASVAPADPIFDQPFDIILGADIVYELSHINLVRGVVERLLRKPSYRLGSPPAYFHLILPLRPTHADEANSVDIAFPRAEDVVSKAATEDEVLAIVKTETYARSAGVGRADEVQYVHYCVGWV